MFKSRNWESSPSFAIRLLWRVEKQKWESPQKNKEADRTTQGAEGFNRPLRNLIAMEGVEGMPVLRSEIAIVDGQRVQRNDQGKMSIETNHRIAIGELHSATPSRVTETPDRVKMD